MTDRRPGGLPLGFRLRAQRVLEYLTFDSAVMRGLVSLASTGAALVLYLARRRPQALAVAMAAHRGNYGGAASRLMDRVFTTDWQPRSSSLREVQRTALGLCRAHMDALAPTPATQRFFARPEAMLGAVVLVLKSAESREKGVLLLVYSHILPTFGRLFNVAAIQERYHVVIEPSWVGYCNPDVLSFRHFRERVYVQAVEPRDRAFIDDQRSNLVSVPIMNNWWVDHRIFRPLPDVRKDADVILVSAWSTYKRHARFFEALRKVRRQGLQLRTILIGYAQGMTMDDVKALAAHFGVADQIECHEGLTPEEVNHHLNRAKVNVLWSRKEGANRSVVEGMFADVPCIMRSGFNYGYAYPYINPSTGLYATEESLPNALIEITQGKTRFDPRSWVVENMSCQRATTILQDAIQRTSNTSWTTGLAVKVNHLNGMGYWTASDADRFEEDYRFLSGQKRG